MPKLLDPQQQRSQRGSKRCEFIAGMGSPFSKYGTDDALAHKQSNDVADIVGAHSKTGIVEPSFSLDLARLQRASQGLENRGPMAVAHPTLEIPVNRWLIVASPRTELLAVRCSTRRQPVETASAGLWIEAPQELEFDESPDYEHGLVQIRARQTRQLRCGHRLNQAGQNPPPFFFVG